MQQQKTNFEKTAVRVSNISIVGNMVLSLLKLAAGLFAGSGAMISDAVHSASDVISSIVVIIGVKLSAKEDDDDHPYGHERFECIAAIILAAVLFMTGALIGKNAIMSLWNGSYATLAGSGAAALIAAVVSIVTKEGMFRYTKHYAKLLDSGALMADAWHHRSDALSSVGALIGIGGAMLGYSWMEPVASVVICCFILKAAVSIFIDASRKMVDRSCSSELRQQLISCAEQQQGVLGISAIRTREFGNRIYVDLDILADGTLTLVESNQIAQRVHAAIEEAFPKIKHIQVKVLPNA